MGEQIAMFMNRAALNQDVGPQRRKRLLQLRCAIDDDELQRLQAATDKVVEQCPPEFRRECGWN
jgi:hypothetical protein